MNSIDSDVVEQLQISEEKAWKSNDKFIFYLNDIKIPVTA